MDLARNIIYYSFHPSQLRYILRWKLSDNPLHRTETQNICFKFLDQTSRSFSPVIKELHPELLLPVCIFYLALRGLDTIEDDISIPLEIKEPLLRGFKDIIDKDGWGFDGNRPEEKDRELLVQFPSVITEFKNLKPVYRAIIKDTVDRMGNGMADYVANNWNIQTTVEYDQYCFYVAGLVGEGLTRFFTAELDFSNPVLSERSQLSRSMGLFLQKTNIIRDIREDNVDKRRFWPKEIWSKHVNDFDDLFKAGNREAALNCSSEMVLNALEHVQDCLFYLASLREQSVFNFCAIPQTMAIATLELCFRNPALFERNMKVTKGDACQLITESTQNLQMLCGTFRRYTRLIEDKNTSKDPNFIEIGMVCGKIEKCIETLLRSQNAEDHRGGKIVNELSATGNEKTEETRLEVFSIVVLPSIVILMVSLIIFGGQFEYVWR
ncbi:bifunctional farnesyl-diphosphate farnesyltransferase/squalene synthase [Aspergillus nanangensis]|uniref:squalene synthase n=1 Tax=Aspergillus nanangensis TaxID=2582783 RepID=A0AAD4CPW8_ASPNN|nr:bifunctional farnesyl-diphosphate farnesyltransferase/squalene synthase [Aspergillus nanangensis]